MLWLSRVFDMPAGSDSCVRFLGAFRLQRHFARCDLPLVGRTREVLAYLAYNANKDIRRTTLSGLVWTDCCDQRSRANLNTALWRINRALKALGNDEISLHVGGSQLKLSVAPSVFVDIFALDGSVRDAAKLCKDGERVALAPDIRQTLINVLAEDCERFLDGWSSEWVLVERERVFNLQIRGLTFLMQDLGESGRIEEALEYGRRILRMDPMRECVQRQVMWLHVLNGHQGNAIRQYLECARILQSELGVSPMPETRALYHFIIAHNPADKAAAPQWPKRTGDLTRAARGEQDDYDEDLTRLRSLISQLNSCRQSVFSALARGGAA